MFEKSEKSERRFVFEWTLLHLLGWIVGVTCGFVLVNRFVFPKLEPNELSPYRWYSDFKIILNMVLFGICFGAIQWLKLRRWKINAFKWILATSLGIGLLGATNSLINSSLIYLTSEISYNSPLSLVLGIIGAVLGLVVGGGAIGGMQSITLKKLIPKQRVWILANIFGILGFGILETVVVGGLLVFKSVFLNFAYSHELDTVVEMRWLLVDYFALIVTPIFSILTIAIPTGKVLKKYIDQP